MVTHNMDNKKMEANNQELENPGLCLAWTLNFRRVNSLAPHLLKPGDRQLRVRYPSHHLVNWKDLTFSGTLPQAAFYSLIHSTKKNYLKSKNDKWLRKLRQGMKEILLLFVIERRVIAKNSSHLN